MHGTTPRRLLTGVVGVLVFAASQNAIAQEPPAAVMFVSRQGMLNGYLFDGSDQVTGAPGFGSASRFAVGAPGRLLVRETDGRIRPLIDGSQPTAGSLHLVDVQAPDVSYDGTKIVFAGLPAGNYTSNDRRVGAHPGAWRIFVINADGTGLRQITHTAPPLDLSQFAFSASSFQRHDDSDPAWLPDGRIVFASTRWPVVAQYQDPRGTNLYVVNADGSRLHRITSERNGGERPVVDPLTGKIVYARWWRNNHNASDNTDTIPFSSGGYSVHLGLAVENDGADLTQEQSQTLGPAKSQSLRNLWISGSINPDGTDLRLWAGRGRLDNTGNAIYGGVFDENGNLYSNIVPLENLAEYAGFGGIRLHTRDGRSGRPVVGQAEFLRFDLPNIYFDRIYVTEYATDPELVRGTNRMLAAIAPDHQQDYGIWIMDRDGSNRTLLYDDPLTMELRPKLLMPRPLPPIISDHPALQNETAMLLPPIKDATATEAASDGTFTFHAMNVYANAPVDSGILSALPIGSAGSIRFYSSYIEDHPSGVNQRNWPNLLGELEISPDGEVIDTKAPANVPLFEQIRSPSSQGYKVPLTNPPFDRNPGNGNDPGAAHVAGQNFGRPGTVVRCVGCHSGHTLIPVPATAEEARFTNLAPGAAVTLSSQESNSNSGPNRLIDRRARTEAFFQHWRSAPGTAAEGQWVHLAFPVDIEVRTVRLYEASNSTIRSVRIRLYSDAAGTREITSAIGGALNRDGVDIPFSDVAARSVRVEFTDVAEAQASLAEVEVIAAGVNTAGPDLSAPNAPTNLRIVQ